MSGRVPLFGLDLGKRCDASAIVGGYRVEGADGLYHYHFPFIHRWPLGTPYRDIRADVQRIVTDPAIDRAAAVVALDLTGVGEPICEDVVRDLPIRVFPVWITGGASWRKDEAKRSYNVAKSLLVSCISVLYGSQRITFPEKLKEGKTLLKELDNFQVKVSKAANELYEAREGQSDDIILALAIACFIGENTCIAPWDYTPDPAARSPFADPPRGLFASDEFGPDGRDDGPHYLPRDD